MTPNVTRIRSTWDVALEGTFLGWDEDGEARVLWDGYTDEDTTLAWEQVRA